MQSYSPSLCSAWSRITLVILVSVQSAVICDWKGAMKVASPGMPIVFEQPLEALKSGAGLGLQEVFGMAEIVENNLFDKFPKWTVLVKHRHKIKLTGTMGFWIQGKEFGVLIPGSRCWFLWSAWIHSKSTSRSAEIISHPAKPHFQCGTRNNCVNTKGPHHPHKW